MHMLLLARLLDYQIPTLPANSFPLDVKPYGEGELQKERRSS